MSWIKETAKKMLADRGYEIRRRDNYFLPRDECFRMLEGKKAFEIVLDVGANIGQTAEKFARLFPNAKIYSLEPFSSAYETLCKKTGKLGNINPRQVALGDSDGKANINVNQASVTNSLLPTHGEFKKFVDGKVADTKGSEEIDVVTLDTFCERENIDSIDLLKIDAQGFENRILEGSTHMLTPHKTRAVYLEVIYFPHYEGQGEFDEIYSIMRRKGYKLYSLYEIYSDASKGYLWSDALFVAADGI